MTKREKLLQEVEQIPDALVQKVLAFIQIEKQQIQQENITEQLRPFGLCEDEFTVPDNFDEPLPEDTLQLFENPA